MRGAAAIAVAALVLAAPSAARPRKVPVFRHVIVIVFENNERDSVLGSGEAPTFDALAHRYATLARYRGLTHPSLPNYLALVSGSTHGITTNCTGCIVRGPCLADTLERAHRTWKTYAEGLPRPGFTGVLAGRYAKKHNPFLYFQTVVSKPARRARVVPLNRFRTDLARRRLPDFSLVVPDLCNSMHDCPVAVGDAWLKSFTKPLLKSRQLARSVVFVVFDEGPPAAAAGSPLPAIVLGPVVRPGSSFNRVTSHYGLLRTIEDAWGLPSLGRSRNVSPITGIWR